MSFLNNASKLLSPYLISLFCISDCIVLYIYSTFNCVAASLNEFNSGVDQIEHFLTQTRILSTLGTKQQHKKIVIIGSNP